MKKILLFVLILFSINAFAQREGRIQKIQFLEGGNIKKSLIKHHYKPLKKVRWGAHFSTLPIKGVLIDTWIWKNGKWVPVGGGQKLKN
jgi:hypothetical protein